jgi:hypothetical protein
MARRTPPQGDSYYLTRINRNFSQVFVTAYGHGITLFNVWTGKEEVYCQIQEWFHTLADEMGHRSVSNKWKDGYVKNK